MSATLGSTLRSLHLWGSEQVAALIEAAKDELQRRGDSDVAPAKLYTKDEMGQLEKENAALKQQVEALGNEKGVILLPGKLDTNGVIAPLNQQDFQVVRTEALEQAKLAILNSSAIFQIGVDYHKMIAAIQAVMTGAALVAIHAGAGEKLRTYVRQYNAHDYLFGRLEDFIGIWDKALVLCPAFLPDKATLTQFSEEVRAFANLCQPIEEGKSDGGELIAHINATAPNHIQELIEELSNIDRGGRPIGTRDPVIAAIKRCAVPLYERHGRKWAKIRDGLWYGLNNRPGGKKLNKDEEMIYDQWRFMGPDSRYEQVRQAFN